MTANPGAVCPIVPGEGHFLGHEPVHRLAAALDHETDGIVMAEAGPGHMGIPDSGPRGVRPP